ncbi:hypothetical protein LG3211_1996 [Lysobacter gummosus]|nr:hypothetical protein LG3211_1996 [Lysobacter gummosus]
MYPGASPAHSHTNRRPRRHPADTPPARNERHPATPPHSPADRPSSGDSP